MQSSAPSDPELLAEWLGQQRESAFHALVARYAGLVHATARRTCGDDSMAAEASQLTFIALAQKAKLLTSCASLGGWLHTTAMMQAKNLIRKAQRENRKRQLLHSAMETEPTNTFDGAWQEMQPVLDDALAALSAKDREALLLRFYRSLSVREIGETLNIATDAAQKRIDRATERLRGKLARRGCQAGGSFSVALAAGFATDAQAAVPAASLLASKAIAAGAAGIGFFPATAAILTTVMKTTSLIPPVVALILAGAWIGSHRQSIYALDRQSDLLEAAISARASSATASSTTVRTSAVSQNNGKTVFDWNEVADRLAKTNPPGHFNDVDQMLFDQRLGSMSKEELVAALDEVAGLDIPKDIRERMDEMLIFPLSVRFPEFTVMRLTDRFQGAVGTSPLYLSDAFKRWAGQDFEKAAGWMDGQNASGVFDTKSLDGKSWLQEHYESALVRALLAKGGDGAARRLDQVPPGQRRHVIMYLTVDELGADEQAPFAKLVRENLSPIEQGQAFGAAADQLSEDLAAVPKFLENIGATPDERAICVGNVAASRVGNLSVSRKVTRDDIVAVREWVGTQMPETVDRSTGQALGNAARIHVKMSFSEASDLAVEFAASSGNDDVLATFLQSEGALSNKVQARALAGKISDETRRAEVLKGLE